MYQRAMLEARENGHRISGDTVVAVERAIRLAIAEITQQLYDSPAGSLTEQRARDISRSLHAVLDELQRRVVEATARGRDLVLTDLSELHKAANLALLEQYAASQIPTGYRAALAARFDVLPLRALQAITARQAAGGGAASFETLVTRNVQGSAAAMDTLLASAVVQGTSTQKLAKGVAAILADGLSPEARAIWLGDLAGVADPDALREVAGLGYDARRIARSETLNALREGDAQGMVLSPVVLGGKWGLSGRHHIYDECDVLAETDFHGMGPGVYPAELWPTAPHPFCGCTRTTPVLRAPSEWFTPKRAPAARTVDPATMPIRDEWKGQWSETRIKRVRANVARALPDSPLVPDPAPLPR